MKPGQLLATIFENRMVAGRLPAGAGNHGLAVGLLGATVVAIVAVSVPCARTTACSHACTAC
jgi:hypothetical protein